MAGREREGEGGEGGRGGGGGGRLSMIKGALYVCFYPTPHFVSHRTLIKYKKTVCFVVVHERCMHMAFRS
jgi:hypothetical protein